jgi:hypothetical protein
VVHGLIAGDAPSDVIGTESPAAPPLAGAVGILGHSALSGSDYVLDYADRRLIVAPAGSLGPIAGGVREPLEILEGRPAVRALFEAEDGSPYPVRLVLDSGATHITLFGRAALRAVGVARTLRAASVVDPLGSRIVPASAASIAFGGRRVRGVAALLPDMTSRSEDGLLPTALFERVYVSVVRKEVALPTRPLDVQGADAPCH